MYYQKTTSNSKFQVCIHLVGDPEIKNSQGFAQWYIGNGLEYFWVCLNCREKLRDESPVNLINIPQEEFDQYEDEQDYIDGNPEILICQDKEIQIIDHIVNLAQFINANRYEVRDIIPIPESNRYLILIENVVMGRLLTERCFYEILEVDFSVQRNNDWIIKRLTNDKIGNLDFKLKLSLKISDYQDYIVIYNTYGRFGTVYTYPKMEYVMEIDRKDYHVQHSHFPVEFLTVNGKTLLFHGVDWNRVDVTDLETGELLTKRDLSKDKELDYFHGLCSVSPDYKWIVDNGWVWQPWGVTLAWKIDDWLNDKKFAPEEAQTITISENWGYDMVWLDNQRVLIWGHPGEEVNFNAVSIYNVESGELEGWFPGPDATLYYDRDKLLLFSVNVKGEFKVWDVTRGCLIFKKENVKIDTYNEFNQEFLSHLGEFLFLTSKYRII